MGTVVQFKRSAIEGAVPSSAVLASGEIAINSADAKLYIKKSDNSVVAISDWVRTRNVLVTTDTNQIVDEFSALSIRSAKYLIQATYNNQYHFTEVIVIHNGTDVYITEYATVFTGSGSLIVVSSDIENDTVRLLITPTNANTIVRTARLDTLLDESESVVPSNLLINGDFDTDFTGWTVTGSPTINIDGNASLAPGNTLSQTVAVSIGTLYEATITYPSFGWQSTLTVSDGNGVLVTSPGQFTSSRTVTFTPTTNQITLTISASGAETIVSVSVMQSS